MPGPIGKGTAAAAAAAAVAALAVPGIATADDDDGGGPTAIGLTAGGSRLVSFSVDHPGRERRLGRIRGLTEDVRLVGLDYRVRNRTLYGVGDKGGVYTLSTRRSTARKVSQLTVPLDGTAFGVDFNATLDRLRVVSDTGQNLRHDIDSGPAAGTTVADSPLRYPAATPATGVTAAAYTANDTDPTTFSTLFDLDVSLGQVAVQSPANLGLLAGTGTLGLADVGADAGFDIYSDVRGGRARSATGYATLTVRGRSRLYAVDLLSGRARSLGSFDDTVTDLAVQLDD